MLPYKDMLNELLSELKTRGADFVRTVDISSLTVERNQGYCIALLIGLILNPVDLSGLSEFSEREKAADRLAEWGADFIIAKGYRAFAQSEDNLSLHGFYDERTKTSPLPHKTIAVMAGLGWIGKNNLLVTRDYGCAFCMCTVLTDAPLPAGNKPVAKSECMECMVCREVCPARAIFGVDWEMGMNRDSIVDVYRCSACLRCLTVCPWTQKYIDLV